MNFFISIGFPVLFFLLIIGIILNYSLLVRLKNKHFSIWKELGEPSLFYNNSLKTGSTVRKFIRKRQDIGIGDKKLTLLVQIVKYYEYAYLTYFIAFIIIMFINKR